MCKVLSKNNLREVKRLIRENCLIRAFPNHPKDEVTNQYKAQLPLSRGYKIKWADESGTLYPTQLPKN